MYIEKAIKLIGTQTKASTLINVAQSTVSSWVNILGYVPVKHIYKIAALTGNKITVEQLLSDHEKREGL